MINDITEKQAVNITFDSRTETITLYDVSYCPSWYGLLPHEKYVVCAGGVYFDSDDSLVQCGWGHSHDDH